MWGGGGGGKGRACVHVCLCVTVCACVVLYVCISAWYLLALTKSEACTLDCL